MADVRALLLALLSGWIAAQVPRAIQHVRADAATRR
jgi:hypothetical protein